MENNEAKTENTEKKRNQILEIPDEYKDDFDKCEMMDFEFLKIPVPVNYHAILSRTYGDYMKFVIGTSLHGNVFFDTDKSYTEYTNR